MKRIFPFFRVIGGETQLQFTHTIRYRARSLQS